jgi:hypothetical protein
MSSPPAAPPPVMTGGAKVYTMDIIKKYAAPLNVYIGLALVLGITYVRQIPEVIRGQANTALGRLLLFILVLLIADMYSWTYGLLMTLFTVLLLSVSPRIDGFQDGGKDIKFVNQKKRWFIEEVMNENPIGIEEDKVKTAAIQDVGNTGRSSGSGHSSSK